MSLKSIFSLKIDENRVFGLDLMRAVAIMMVMVYHAIPMSPFLISNQKFVFLDGVSVFFVLSGFLIGQILIKTFNKNGINFKTILNFWIRRWFRTLPLYFLFLIVLIAISKAFIPGLALRGTIPYFFFLQNFFSPIRYGFFIESWSLCVEEWFYISLPLLVLLSSKLLRLKFMQTILLCTSVFIIFSFYSRITTDNAGTVANRLDSIMFGVIGALFYIYFPKIWDKKRKTCFIIGLLLLMIIQACTMNKLDNFVGLYIYYPVINLALFLMLPFLSKLKRPKNYLFYRIITTISLISYSLYLVNYTLIRKIFLEHFLSQVLSQNQQFLIFWFLSFVSAFFLYKYFEIPMIKLRDKIKIR